MNQDQKDLYEKIQAFSVDEPGSSFTFTRRLASENGWSAAYAERVVQEYKRFVFLAVAAGHPVSPSDEVDQAWHLHMTYTRSYWERLCGEVLEQPLHHSPTRGGREEQRKFASWYENTLGSYLSFFGTNPPPDIWPDPLLRSKEEVRYERVDRNRCVVVPRKWPRLGLLLLAAGISVGLLFMCGEVIAGAVKDVLNQPGPDFLGFYILSFFAILIAGLTFRRSQRKPDDEPVGEELDLHPYEAAYLAAGETRAANAAIAGLVSRGLLVPVPKEHRLKRAGELPPDAHPLDRDLHRSASAILGSEVSALHFAAQPALARIRSRLVSLGLLVAGGRDAVARAVPLLSLLALGVLGAVKIVVGADRHRPVAFLILLLLISAAIGLALFARGLGRSRRGDLAADRLQALHAPLRRKAVHGEAGMTPLEVPMAAGLFGLAALSGGPFDSLNETIHPPSVRAGGDGSGCGSGGCGGGGCGGGGCGGGCGGCGGCGGGG